MNRYQTLAAEIEDTIRADVLRPGDRLPSVRQLSTSRGVSASTVFQAYYLLEARGLVRARERSGYFVAPAKRALPLPQLVSEPQDASRPVDVAERVFQVLEASMSCSVAPFGSPFPSPTLFPLARLGKDMAASAKTLNASQVLDDMSPGKESLRHQIALRYAADGMAVAAQDIVITSGALEALNLCLSAVTRPGDSVVVESPTFYAALQAIERLGLRVIEVPTHPTDGIELEALERAITTHRPKACWLMTTFQNPLGCTMPDAKKQALVALLARHEVPLIEDDVYAELYFGAKRPPPAKAFDRQGLVLHCSSFSKCLSPGYRVGWVVPGRFTQAVRRHKLTTSLATSAPAQLGLARYLERGGYDKHLRKLRQTLAAQLAAYAEAVCNAFPEGSMATHPQGGYFLWVKLPLGADTMALHREAAAHGISIAPGPIFSASGEFTNCVRLNYGHPLDDGLRQAIQTLGRLAAAR